MASKTDREAAQEMAAKWEAEASDLERMSGRVGDYTPLECRMLKQHAHVKRACAQELKLEMQRVRRG